MEMIICKSLPLSGVVLPIIKIVLKSNTLIPLIFIATIKLLSFLLLKLLINNISAPL